MRFARLISGIAALIVVIVSAGCSLLQIEGFQDNFEGTRSTVWKDYGGTWIVTDGQLAVGAGEGYRCLASGVDLTDFVLEADVTSGNDTTTSQTGLVFRVTAPGVGAYAYCGYFAGIDVKGNILMLRKVDGAVWTEIGQAMMAPPLVKDAKHRLKIVAKGDRIRIYLDDMFHSLLDKNDGTWSQGIVGLSSHQAAAKFDNVIATARF